MQRWRILWPTLVVAILAAACGAGTAPTPAQSTTSAASGSLAAATARPAVTLDIGVVLPFSGTLAYLGDLQGGGMDAAVKEANEGAGINGHIKLNVIRQDGQADPTTSVQAMNKLVSLNKVPFVMTGLSGPSLAMGPVADQNKTLLFMSGGNTPALAAAAQYLYSSALNAIVEVETMGKYVSQTLRAKTVAIYADSGAYGQGSAKVVKASWPQLGLQVVGEVDTDLTSTDHATNLAKLKELHADVVYVILAGGLTTSTFLKQARQLGLPGQLVSQIGLDNEDVVKNSAGGAEGVVFTSEAYDFTSSRPQMTHFMDAFKKYEGKAADDPYQAAYYEGMQMVIAAIRSADQQGSGLTGETIAKALVAIKCFDGLMGTVCLRNDHLADKPVAIKQVKNGARTILTVLQAK